MSNGAKLVTALYDSCAADTLDLRGARTIGYLESNSVGQCAQALAKETHTTHAVYWVRGDEIRQIWQGERK